MTDDKTQPSVNDRPEQAKPEQTGQQAQPSQANAATQPSPRVSAGRRPLFRS
jgi:hypothetical protein